MMPTSTQMVRSPSAHSATATKPVAPLLRAPGVDVDSRLDSAIDLAESALLSRHYPEGYWMGELQGDSILESEYILLRFILGHDADADLPLIGNYLRSLQQPDGGWNLYPGGVSDLSGTVKAYFALKLLGDSPEAEHMVRARQIIHRLGGAQKCNSFSNFYLAALGQISYDACPSIPPEIVFLPRWVYFNLYAVSAWTRTMILPLAIVSSLRPVRSLSAEQGIAELFTGPSSLVNQSWGLPSNLRQLFLLIDQVLKKYQENAVKPLRQQAIKEAEKWLIEHMEGSQGLGAIFPPMVYILIVFRALGYPDDHPLVVEAHGHLKGLFIKEDDAIRIQPCLSPVWDTGIALHALAEAGHSPESDIAKRTTQWLLNRECRQPSDWAKSCPGVEASGWFFEHANPHYPDVDDTAMVVMALRRMGGDAAEDAIRRGINWLLAFQNDDGGWAAFDRTKDRWILEHVPFADHNAMQDPSCPDITGRVLECFGHCGITIKNPAVRRAIRFLREHQEKEGCWFGRWGVNYIYGTWQVLTGLRKAGEQMDRRYIRKAADWLRGVQKGDGSFGESCDTYDNPSLKGQGQSTASQTAWGVMALMAAAGPDDPAVQKAIGWLTKSQPASGCWEEKWYTGTGFPRVFYLKYHLYRLYFPLMALSRYRRMKAAALAQ